MENLLLSLSVGVISIVIIHTALRKSFKISSFITALITLAIAASLYIPLLVIDWPGVDVFAIQIAIYCITVYLLSVLHHQALNQKAGSKKRLHWAPFLIVGFFIIVVSVDSIFITIAQKGSDSFLGDLIVPTPRSGGKATSVFPGIIEHDFQEKEDQYNQYQKRLTEQRNRGWNVKFGWIEEPIVKKQATFKLSLLNAKKEAITSAAVTGVFQRGNSSKLDKKVILKEIGEGLYSTDVTLDYHGRWELILKVKSPEGDYDITATTEVLK